MYGTVDGVHLGKISATSVLRKSVLFMPDLETCVICGKSSQTWGMICQMIGCIQSGTSWLYYKQVFGHQNWIVENSDQNQDTLEAAQLKALELEKQHNHM